MRSTCSNDNTSFNVSENKTQMHSHDSGLKNQAHTKRWSSFSNSGGYILSPGEVGAEVDVAAEAAVGVVVSIGGVVEV